MAAMGPDVEMTAAVVATETATETAATATVTGGAPSAAVRAVVDRLHATELLRRHGDSAEQREELQRLMSALERAQHEYMEKQALQNLLEKLMRVERPEDLETMLANRERVLKAYEKSRAELEDARRERDDQLQRIGELGETIEQEKAKLVALNATHPAHESELEKLKSEWKELQRRNARRKTAIQLATGMMLNDESDCARILEQQTRGIQQLHEKQKHLEERKMDLMTQVKQTTEKIATIEKENEAMSNNLEIKQREEECGNLEHMREWYQQMNQLLTTISGVDIVQITEEFMELRILQSHTIRAFFHATTTRLERIEFDPADIPSQDLVDIAVAANDLQLLIAEYRERIRGL